MVRPLSAKPLDRRQKSLRLLHEGTALSWKEMMDSPSGRLYRSFSVWFLRTIPIVFSAVVGTMFTYELLALRPHGVLEFWLVVTGAVLGWAATVWLVRSAVQTVRDVQ